MSTKANHPSNLTEKQKRIIQYLSDQVGEKTYFKSRNIATALGMNPKEVGANMPHVRKATQDISIEKWGYSSSTTWKVTKA